MAPFEAGHDVHEGLEPDSEGGEGGGGVRRAIVEVELVDEFVEGFGVALESEKMISLPGNCDGHIGGEGLGWATPMYRSHGGLAPLRHTFACCTACLLARDRGQAQNMVSRDDNVLITRFDSCRSMGHED